MDARNLFGSGNEQTLPFLKTSWTVVLRNPQQKMQCPHLGYIRPENKGIFTEI